MNHKDDKRHGGKQRLWRRVVRWGAADEAATSTVSVHVHGGRGGRGVGVTVHGDGNRMMRPDALSQLGWEVRGEGGTKGGRFPVQWFASPEGVAMEPFWRLDRQYPSRWPGRSWRQINGCARQCWGFICITRLILRFRQAA
jgi:hypothetical protein